MTKTIYNKNRKELAKKAVEIIKQEIEQTDGNIVLGIPGGRSIKDIFEELKQTDLPWERIQIRFVDERIVPNDHVDSNYRLAKESFLDEIDIPIKNIYPLNFKDNTKKALDNYNKSFNKFDIIILGVGEDGHIGALYPNHHSIKNTEDKYIAMNDSPKPPPNRITGTQKAFLTANLAIALFLGEAKQEAFNNYKNKNIIINDCPVKLIDKINEAYILTDIEE